MDTSLLLVIILVLLIFLFAAFAIKLIKYLRQKKTNTELWATIFEGIAQKTINLEAFKEADSFIEKKSQRDGQDKDSVKASTAGDN